MTQLSLPTVLSGAGSSRSRRSGTAAATVRAKVMVHEHEDGAMAVFHGGPEAGALRRQSVSGWAKGRGGRVRASASLLWLASFASSGGGTPKRNGVAWGPLTD